MNFKEDLLVPFDIENAISVGVYERVRQHAEDLFDKASKLTGSFKTYKAESLKNNPFILPALQQRLVYLLTFA